MNLLNYKKQRNKTTDLIWPCTFQEMYSGLSIWPGMSLIFAWPGLMTKKLNKGICVSVHLKWLREWEVRRRWCVSSWGRTQVTPRLSMQCLAPISHLVWPLKLGCCQGNAAQTWFISHALYTPLLLFPLSLPFPLLLLCPASALNSLPACCHIYYLQAFGIDHNIDFGYAVPTYLLQRC